MQDYDDSRFGNHTRKFSLKRLKFHVSESLHKIKAITLSENYLCKSR